MSRPASHAGCNSKNLEFSPEEKQALLESVSNSELLLDDPFAEIAQAIGHENFAKLTAVLGGEKVHIPQEQSFYQRLHREKNKSDILRFVLEQMQSGVNQCGACRQTAEKYNVSFSWVRDLLLRSRQ